MKLRRSLYRALALAMGITLLLGGMGGTADATGGHRITFGASTLAPEVPGTPVPLPKPTPIPEPTVRPNTHGQIIFGVDTIAYTTPSPEPTPNPQQNPSEPDKRKTRAILLYMVGSNLESRYGCASADLKELLSAGIDLRYTTVLVCAGGAQRWQGLDLAYGEVAYFELREGGFQRLTEPRRLNMGEPGTLASFLRYGHASVQADAYDLILWDHGGGPLVGFGADETNLTASGSADILTMRELTEALKNSPFGSGEKLEYIGFDACLMGSVEVAALLAPYADYLIASEEVLPGNGWDYTAFGNDSLPYYSTVGVLSYIAEQTAAYYSKSASSGPVTLAVFDLSRIQGVVQAMNQVFSGSFVRADYVALSRLVDRVKHMDNDNSNANQDLDLYDLYGFAQALDERSAEQAQALRNALRDLVVARAVNSAAAGHSGISFYYPLINTRAIPSLVAEYKFLADSGLFSQYYQFLRGFTQNTRVATGKSMPAVIRAGRGGLGSGEAEVPALTVIALKGDAANTVIAGQDALRYEVEMDIGLLNTFIRSYYLVLEAEGEDVYRLMERGHGLDLSDDGKLSVTLKRAVRLIRGGEGQAWQPLPLTEGERYGDYIGYTTETLLRQAQDVRLMQGAVSVEPAHPDGALDRLSTASDTLVPLAIYQEVAPGDCLTPVYQQRKLTVGEDGQPLPFDFWTPVGTGTAYGTEFEVGSEGPQLAHLPLPEGKRYYVQLCVEDIDGTVYATELKELK
ncbi:MAG: hypothetical protein IJ240_00970 [Clostridia bacterium]|nr:hypothetical protein [Clostridia bacterium]